MEEFAIQAQVSPVGRFGRRTSAAVTDLAGGKVGMLLEAPLQPKVMFLKCLNEMNIS